jgi:hypothetical protein
MVLGGSGNFEWGSE